MITDGLWDAFNDYHMGQTAENLAEKYQITREEQDAFAVASQNKAEAAKKDGKFKDEIVPVTLSKRARAKSFSIVMNIFVKARPSMAVSGLKPAFKRDGGSVTAANASGINDGAAALIVMSEKEADKRVILRRWRGLRHGRIAASIRRSWASARRRRAASLEKAGWSLDDLDLIEANEAFAAQALAVGKELGWDADPRSTSMAAPSRIGHPIGASGARILTTLSTNCSARANRKALRPSASAAAWAWRSV